MSTVQKILIPPRTLLIAFKIRDSLVFPAHNAIGASLVHQCICATLKKAAIPIKQRSQWAPLNNALNAFTVDDPLDASCVVFDFLKTIPYLDLASEVRMFVWPTDESRWVQVWPSNSQEDPQVYFLAAFNALAEYNAAVQSEIDKANQFTICPP